MISLFFFGRVGRSLSMELEREENQHGSPSPFPHPDQSHCRDAREDDDDTSGDDNNLSDRDGGTRFHPLWTRLLPLLVSHLGMWPRLTR
jgi:hypothetical protein